MVINCDKNKFSKKKKKNLLVRDRRSRQSFLSGGGVVFAAGREFWCPRRCAGNVGAPAQVDDHDLVAGATFVHGGDYVFDRRRVLYAGRALVYYRQQE